MLMKRAILAVGATFAWVVTHPAVGVGQSSPPTTPSGFHILGTTTTPPPPPSGTTDVPVVTWNINVSDSSAAHAKAAMGYLMGLTPRPQIIVVQEARQSQFNTYLSELQARTGVSWSGVMKTHCPPGKWSGSACTGTEDEGVGVFTSLPLQNSSVLYFPYADAYHSARAAVRAAISVNGVTMQVFGVHLIPGNATARYSSMTTLKSTASNYASPKLAAGDFNADPDQITSSQGMGSGFVEAWLTVGTGGRFTYPVPTPTMKLDYWFSDANGKAQPTKASVLTGSGSISDHYPVSATYRVSSN